MTRKRLFIAAILVALTLLHSNAWARSGKEYKFRGAPDGSHPTSGLTVDSAGNIYGTTEWGGNTGGRTCSDVGCGTVFVFSRRPGGGWTKSVIYRFSGGADGYKPGGTLSFDAEGNLYGTASGGNSGYGVVFELVPIGDGTWRETVIYNFLNYADGAFPWSGVIFDPAGNLFGTTTAGGDCNNCGTVFKLTPTQDGHWTKVTIHSFAVGQGGSSFAGPLTMSNAGRLYGTTLGNGVFGWGTIYELIPNQDGTWTENTLHDFQDGLDGGNPQGILAFDQDGNIFGEAYSGGSLACPVTGCGVIFRLTPVQDGGWQYDVAYTFNGLNGKKGRAPVGGVVLGAGGSLFGTTSQGGDLNCAGNPQGCGTVFKLSPTDGRQFDIQILGFFDGANGIGPSSGVMFDPTGSIYGTASGGGNDCTYGGCGVIFRLTP